jgi:hypothetical protein
MNPTAIVFWMILASIGFLIGGTVSAAVVGLLIGLLFSFIVTVFL